MELSSETKAGLRLLSDPSLNVSALSAAALALALGRATTDRVAGTNPWNVRACGSVAILWRLWLPLWPTRPTHNICALHVNGMHIL
jgi:hypothetical protein